MITGIHHTSFTVSNLDRSLAFYRDILGMELVVERDVTGDYMADLMGFENLHIRLVFLKIGEELLELIEYLSPSGNIVNTKKNNPGTAHICFRIKDLLSLYKKLVLSGVCVESEPVAITKGPNKGGFAMFIYDPDGIPLELLETPASM